MKILLFNNVVFQCAKTRDRAKYCDCGFPRKWKLALILLVELLAVTVTAIVTVTVHSPIPVLELVPLSQNSRCHHNLGVSPEALRPPPLTIVHSPILTCSGACAALAK
jgi:hypothetical protein